MDKNEKKTEMFVIYGVLILVSIFLILYFINSDGTEETSTYLFIFSFVLIISILIGFFWFMKNKN